MRENVTIRPMTGADIPAADRLRDLAGWNQTEKDWRRFLQLNAKGCFVACTNDVCGTVTTLNYENRFGWIGMVLVDPQHRRQGIGKRLLKVGIQCLENLGVETIKLDATSMGRPLYLRDSFLDEYGIERWEGERLRIADGGLRNASAQLRSGPTLSAMTLEHLRAVCHCDRQIFGADRASLLRAIWRENASLCAVAHFEDRIYGYVLGRAGARACHLGPWVAWNEAIACELLSWFLRSRTGERLFVDVCLKNPFARDLVQIAGFQFQRPLMRMYRGPNNHPGQPERVCSIAGPELG